MPTKILTDIGLTNKEAEVYELLLRIGESPVSAVIKETKSHPQVIYRVVDSLVDKGLVLKVIKKSKIFISAENPKQLEKIEEEKLRKLREAIPDLTELQKVSKSAIVRVARGEEAVRALRFREVQESKRGETYYIIGGSGDRYYKVMGEVHEELEKKRVKKKVKKKLISFSNQKEQLEKDPFRELAEFRYLPDEYPVETSTNIFGNTVGIIIWAADPIVITIESEEVAESYKKYFYLLWHIAQ